MSYLLPLCTVLMLASTYLGLRALARHVRLRLLELATAAAGVRVEERYTQPWRACVLGRAGEVPVRLVGEASAHLAVWAGVGGPLPLGLHLERQSRLPGLARLRGLRDLRVGVPELDAALQVHSDHPASAIRLLRDPRVQDVLRRLYCAFPTARVAHAEVRVQVGPWSRGSKVLEAARLAVEVARTLSEAAQVTSPAAREASPLDPRAMGEIGAVAESPHERQEAWMLETYGRQQRLHLVFFAGLLLLSIGIPSLLALPGSPLERWAGLTRGDWERVSGTLLASAFFMSALTNRCPACGSLQWFRRNWEPRCPGCQLELGWRFW